MSDGVCLSCGSVVQVEIRQFVWPGSVLWCGTDRCLPFDLCSPPVLKNGAGLIRIRSVCIGCIGDGIDSSGSSLSRFGLNRILMSPTRLRFLQCVGNRHNIELLQMVLIDNYVFMDVFSIQMRCNVNDNAYTIDTKNFVYSTWNRSKDAIAGFLGFCR